MTVFSFWLICINQEQASTWEKMNLMLETLNDLENKKITRGGDFNLFLNSALEAEGGSLVLKNLLFQNSLKLKKNTTYVTFRVLEMRNNFC